MDKASPNIDILPMLAEGLTFSAGGKDILCQINFRLNADGKTFIVGPNGAGNLWKSTLLKILCNKLKPKDEGIRDNHYFHHSYLLNINYTKHHNDHLRVSILSNFFLLHK